MRYRAKITVITQGKAYGPGSILPDDISKFDLAFLKAKKFVEPVDVSAVPYEEPEDEAEDDSGQESGGFSGFDEMEPPGLKSPDAVRKIRSKKEVAAYAESIGFSLGENYDEKSLKELQEIVINFQEEQMENGASDETGEE